MDVSFKDIETLSQKPTISGDEKIPVTKDLFITPQQIAELSDEPGTLNTNNSEAQTPNASEPLKNNINLHKVSKTGNYEHLLNRPDIPALTQRVATIEGKIPSEASTSNKLADKAWVNTKIAPFITKSVDDLLNYYLKSETYTKEEVNNIVGALNQFKYEIYPSLSSVTNPSPSVLYLIGPTGSGSDKYEEYVYANGGFVKIGDTTIDLSNYVTITMLNTALALYTTTEELMQMLDLMDARKANVDGYYETMGVGLAKNLEGRSDVVDSFAERTTGGDAEVSNGAAQLNEVAGRSQVWNQLVGAITEVPNAANFTTEGDETICAFTQTATTRVVSWQNVNILAGHRYLVLVRLKSSRATSGPAGSYVGPYIRIHTTNNTVYSSLAISQAGVYTTISRFFTAEVSYKTSYTDGILLSSNPEGESFPIITYKTGKLCQYFDLTIMFGAGNEPSTLAEFEAWLAKNISLKPYYPTNAGTVLNAKMKGIESLGFNLLNPTTGKARIIGAYSDVYGNYYGITGTHGTLTFTSDFGEVSEITPDIDGKFLISTPGWLDVASAGADCAVFLWWDGTQTEYEEYERNVANFDATHIYGKLNGTGERVQVFPDGMAGIGSAKDVVRVEDDAVVARKRIGKVADMGSLTWDYYQDNQDFRSTIVYKRGISGSGESNVICPKYATTQRTSYANQPQYTIMEPETSSPGKYVSIKDAAYTDATELKASLSGVPLYYELATEQLYTDLVYIGSDLFADGTPVTLPVNYIVNNWGIERMLPQNDTDVITTFPEVSCRYAIDAVEELNTHSDEIEDLYEGLDELDAKKPNKSGSYPDMAVGSAKAIEGNNTKVEDFVFTPIQCADGLAQIKSVKGKSLAWNQLLSNGNFEDTTGWSVLRGTLSVADGVATITPTDTSNSVALGGPATSYKWIEGHKYIVKALMKGNSGNLCYFTAYYGGLSGSINLILNGSWQEMAILFTATSADAAYASMRIGITQGTDANLNPFLVTGIMVIDLTLMGIADQITTVADFTAKYPLSYYADNAGALISNKTEQVESVGFNQWDEEWERGTINTTTGQDGDSDIRIRSKNYIPVFPGVSYYFRGPQSIYVLFYDIDKNYINYTFLVNNTLAITDGCHFIRLRIGSSQAPITTYNHDICINLSDPSRNGEYEPYKKNTVTLNLPTLTGKLNGEGESVVVFPNGLKSAGSVYDEIVGNKAIKRVGVVDMGTLTWYYKTTGSGTGEGVYPYLYANVPGSKESFSAICAKYGISIDGSAFNAGRDKSISGYAMSGASRISTRDSAYTDAADFKAAMNGVMLYFGLATPEEYILDEPIPDTFQAYKGGTLKQLPENTAEPITAPMVMENVYAIDAVGILTGLPQNYMSKESMQAFLSALGTAMNGTWAMTWDDQNGRYAFTFTPNA